MILKCTFKNKACDSILIGDVKQIHIRCFNLEEGSVDLYFNQDNALFLVDQQLVSRFISETKKPYPIKELSVVRNEGENLHIFTDSVAFVLEKGKTVDKINASFSIDFREWVECMKKEVVKIPIEIEGKEASISAEINK